MVDHLQLFLTAQHAFTERVHSVAPDQWQLGTPDTEWSVKDLVEHLVDEHRWAAPLLHGHDLDTAAVIVRGARDEGSPAGNWEVAAVQSADAFSGEGALDRSVSLSRGDTPVRTYVEEMIFDLVVHAWDLATAIGYDGALPADVVDAVWTLAQELGDLSGTDMFAAPVPVPEDAATIDKLVARTGRTPR